MKRLLLGMSVLALTGCGWMGGGSGHNYHHNSYQNYHGGYYGHQGHQGYQQPVQVYPSRASYGNTHLEVTAGIEEFTGGNVLPRQPINGGVINKVEYKEAYDTAWRVAGGIAHDVAPRTTLLARGFYKQADSSDDPQLVFTNGTTATGSFSDYKSYGAEIGFREYLNNSGEQLRPYMGATAGAAYVEAIDLHNLSIGGNPAAVAPIRVSDGDWVPTASAIVGVEMPVSNSLSLGLESGLRYEGKRDVQIGTLPASETSNAFSVPVQLRGRFRF